MLAVGRGLIHVGKFTREMNWGRIRIESIGVWRRPKKEKQSNVAAEADGIM
jgi:hypothetical protein